LRLSGDTPHRRQTVTSTLGHENAHPHQSSPCIAGQRVLTAARISRVADDREHPKDGQDTDDAFDRHVGQVLEQEAEVLREQADLLITSGSISLERPTGVLTAHLRPPTWWRRGELENRTVAAGRTASGRTPLSRAAYRDHAGLRAEIMLQIAVQLTWLEQEWSATVRGAAHRARAAREADHARPSGQLKTTMEKAQ
jgi:hypothetical protein